MIKAYEDVNELSQLMFAHWQVPPIFEDDGCSSA
jgi:hypothetical protein